MTLAFTAARAFLLRLSLSFIACLTLFFVLGLVDALGRSHGAAENLYTLVLLVISGAIDQVCLLAPALAFLSAVATGTAWAQYGELEAAFCSGRSPWQLASAMALSAFGFGLVLITYQETVGLRAATWRHQLEASRPGAKQSLAQALARHTAWVSAGHFILHLPFRATQTESSCATRIVKFREPTLYDFRGGSLASVTTGDLLVAHGGDWHLVNAQVHTLKFEGIEKASSWAVDLPLSGSNLMALSADPSAESLTRLWRLIKQRERAGKNAVGMRLLAFRRLVPALVSPCWVLFAAPLALAPGRRRSLAQSLGQGTAIIALTLALGHIARLLALARVIQVAPAVFVEPIAGALMTYLMARFRRV